MTCFTVGILYYYLPALYLIICSPGDHMQHCSALVAGINLKEPASNEITDSETKSNGVTHSLQQPPNDLLPLRDDHDDMMEDSTILQDQQQQDEQTQFTSAADTIGIELSTVESSSDCHDRAPSKHSHSNSVETGLYLHCIL